MTKCVINIDEISLDETPPMFKPSTDAAQRLGCGWRPWDRA